MSGRDETVFDNLVLDRVIPPSPWISSSIRRNSMANRWISNSGIQVSVHSLLYHQYRCLCIFSGSREIWQYPPFLFSSSTRLHHGRIYKAFASPSIAYVSSRSSMPRERSPTRIWIGGTASCVIFDHRFRACVLWIRLIRPWKWQRSHSPFRRSMICLYTLSPLLMGRMLSGFSATLFVSPRPTERVIRKIL